MLCDMKDAEQPAEVRTSISCTRTESSVDVRLRGFSSRVSVEQALDWVDAHASRLEWEEIALHEAIGRIPAAPVACPTDLPVSDCAAIDGYAVRSEETIGAGSYNPLSFANRPSGENLPRGSATLVLAGIPLPLGANAVLPFEGATESGMELEVCTPVSHGYGINRRGQEIGANPKILYSVRHRLVLPALAWMVRQWGDDYAAFAIRRIGTPEATALLAKLENDGDEAAKAVRDSARLSPRILWLAGNDPHILPAITSPLPARQVEKEPRLAMIDGPTGRVLFTLDDIVRFDWHKQILQLTPERAMDRHGHRRAAG
jgi:hypothetical protein